MADASARAPELREQRAYAGTPEDLIPVFQEALDRFPLDKGAVDIIEYSQDDFKAPADLTSMRKPRNMFIINELAKKHSRLIFKGRTLTLALKATLQEAKLVPKVKQAQKGKGILVNALKVASGQSLFCRAMLAHVRNWWYRRMSVGDLEELLPRPPAVEDPHEDEDDDDANDDDAYSDTSALQAVSRSPTPARSSPGSATKMCPPPPPPPPSSRSSMSCRPSSLSRASSSSTDLGAAVDPDITSAQFARLWANVTAYLADDAHEDAVAAESDEIHDIVGPEDAL